MVSQIYLNQISAITLRRGTIHHPYGRKAEEGMDKGAR